MRRRLQSEGDADVIAFLNSAIDILNLAVTDPAQLAQIWVACFSTNYRNGARMADTALNLMRMNFDPLQVISAMR